ncbi:MAG TPA: protein-glutamate O-methyltransferase CheR [Selenomonadales bacterium]|nr:protein-glutamate O-methyltransferase CheR [Selenomonadales bacterium]
METITDREFMDLVQFIKLNYGINLAEKKSLVLGRLHNYILQGGFGSFSAYFRHVVSDPTGQAVVVLIDKLTTNHTYFMREPQHFAFLERVVLPYLAKAGGAARDLRIWSAGCSTGEEPYTLAMMIDSFFGSEKRQWDAKILATDISTMALGKGKQGIYPSSGLEGLPENWKKRYFRPYNQENHILTEQIRSEVVFRRFNLINEAFPFKKKFHVIFCRNVMIYFDAEARRDLIRRFYQQTEPGGYLFIGHSESVNRSETKYEFVAPAVYRKGQ